MTVTTLSERDYYTGFIQSRCEGTTSADLRLPFFHTCRGEVFRKVIASRQLDATLCEEFEEELLYLFYGRPAYRVSGSETTRDLGRFPVCFIINASAATSIKRVFPFDTGAFLRSILKEYCGCFANKNEAMSALLGYQLGSDLDILAKFIRTVYGDDNQYLQVAPVLRSEDLMGMCFELKRMLDMANAQSSKDWDNRAVTSEIQIQASVDIGSGSVDAVILPTQFISGDEPLQQFFYENDIQVLSYDVARMKPENATELVDREARAYYAQNGII